jgi:hypothetical protein
MKVTEALIEIVGKKAETGAGYSQLCIQAVSLCEYFVALLIP